MTPTSGPSATDPLRDASEAYALLAAWERQGAEQVARATAVATAIEAVRVTRWSAARDVAVTVDSSGLLVDLVVTERALAATPLALGRTITSTYARALTQLRAEVEEAVVTAVGPADPLGRSAVDHYRAVLPDGEH
ncbi:hypothetical protein [Cellulomonas sp. URHD0024]|uniref:hypothetical protein n=1 Tax=Cellulomonas sp. URHD0024 TaxID=1302620 RepID=UPI00041AC222|nr:hypothetical protein [Cellulomonas sp. URHD0024]